MVKIRPKYPYYGLDEEYKKICTDLKEIKLVIVGKDPFPTDAMGIPFCKEKWDMFQKNQSGIKVVESIDKDYEKKKNMAPKAYFMYLAENGMVLLNASYYFLEGEKVSRKRHFEFVRKSLKINFPFLCKADHVFLCGDAYKMINWVVDGLSDKKHKVMHPSPQAYNSARGKDKKQEWKKYWSPGVIQKMLKLKLKEH